MNALKTYALTRLFKWFGRMRPATRQRAGAFVGWLSLKLAGKRLRIVRKNLELCFPDASPQQRDQWLHEHFRALGQSIVDRGVLWFGTEDAIRAMATQSGAERINAIAATGRPVILLAPHFIGLDVAATRLTMEVPSGATMYTPQSDPAVDAIVRAGRARFNEVFLVSRKDGIRDLIRHFREARPVYYLPDMDFGRQGAVFVPFFGVPAATLVATAQLARKWNAAVLPILDFWDPATGRYHVEVLEPLADFPGDDDNEAATARLNREIESWVRRCPSQYYWVHRRFKTRPLGEAKFY
ncbi:acyltransferase [Bordetella genomosp. 1]|uniref:Acyltransferase n=1 Tax=Bordetella genomosp. 1 TaxID=1395607 RepID=A0A261RUY8_9BORD|nr:lysophospholipid acyltransferase family protein [Bordetella genomosp. 1]MDQ8031923.1 lysophospholipid acyltransferase family protein [Bordetella sp.]OZI28103.1 acyltransferase [Bordetella genomosp. 1]OZI68201.1 acyltransferase [Bordetella genomosp. 1]